MKDFFQSTKFKILAAVFVVLCAFMLRATMSGGLTPLTSQLLSVVTTPLQSAASGISESVGGLYRHLFQAGEIEEENAQLEEKVRTLTQQVADLERYRRENEQLREYLEIKEEHSDFSFASASVIGRDTAERFYSFTIDAGSEAGIEKFDPVITSDGLVGLVSEVGKNYAKVLTILDTTIEVGAYDIRTRDIGTTSGDITLARNGQLRLNMLPKDCTVSQGDLIYTTGYGGLYPKVCHRRGHRGPYRFQRHEQYAVIDPLSDIETVKDVLVITSFEGQGNRFLNNSGWAGERKDPWDANGH